MLSPARVEVLAFEYATYTPPIVIADPVAGKIDTYYSFVLAAGTVNTIVRYLS